jgi:hypothetical protein
MQSLLQQSQDGKRSALAEHNGHFSAQNSRQGFGESSKRAAERSAASGDDVMDDNTRAIKNILDREFPEQTIPVNANIREAIDIFYKVNASGVSLTDAELALAQISGYWPDARDTFKRKLSELADKGFVFKLDFIVFVLLGCLYHLGSDMKKLHDVENNDRIRAAWKLLPRARDTLPGLWCIDPIPSSRAWRLA